MREFRKRRAAAAFAAMFLLVLAAAVAAGLPYAYGVEDESRPWVRIIQPFSGSIVPTSNGEITVVGTSKDRPGGTGVKIVEVKVNGSKYSAAKPVRPDDWSWWKVTIEVHSSGIYRITPRATDNAGNQAWNSVYVKVVFDSNPPSLSIVRPQASSSLETDSLLVQGKAYDRETGIRTLRAKLDSSPYVHAIPKSVGDWSTWTVSFGTVTEGRHTIHATAVDRAGNVKDATVTVTTRDGSSIDSIAPMVFASPASGSFTGETLVSLTATERASIYYTTDGTSPTISSKLYSGPVTISSSTTLRYFAMDAAGNIGSISTQAYVISSPDTADPIIAIVQPEDDSEVPVSSGAITIKGTASDTGTGIKVVEVRVDDGSYKAATPKAPGDWSSWTVTMPVAQGERRLVPRATDFAGNQAWNSIYISVVSASPAPEPLPEPEPAPAPVPAGDLDQFGIAKLYPTASGMGNEYYTKTNAATVSEFRDGGRIDRLPSDFSKNSDGSWNIPSNSTPRWVITGGWRNIEMTMQLKINSGGLVQLYANGEQHTNDVTGAWHGSANKMRVYADGRMGFIKELYHEAGNSGYSSEVATRDSGSSITGKWVTVKYVGYNIDGNTKRKLEAYISLNNDNRFIKVAEYVDSGGWHASSRFDSFMSSMKQRYPSHVPQNRDTGEVIRVNEVITWMGDWVSFRSDGADYDFKNVSVREISASSGANLKYVTNALTQAASLERAYVEPAHHHED
jgi:hypothetical protein